MARFINVLAKNYDPYNIDQNMFSMWIPSERSVPLVCTSLISEDGFGKATVDGIPISKGKCEKFEFSPLPIYFLPVGEVANEYDKIYTVKLTGFKSVNGKKFKDHSFKIKTSKKLIDDGKHKENEKVAKDVSDEGIVLLENNGILPLKKETEISLLGEYYNYRISGIGAALIKPRWNFTIIEALENSNKLKISQKAKIGIFFISRRSGENIDNKPIKGDYYLTDKEKEDLLEVKIQFKHLVVVLNTGYPIEMKFLKEVNPAAIIWTGFSGQRGSESLIDILVGDVNPSARLADTWPLDYYDVPSSQNYINQDEKSPILSDDGKKVGASVYYEEQQFVGYRYFDSYNKEAAFFFGHGLSYTKFETVSDASFSKQLLNIKTTVKNIGKNRGKNSVLFYVESPKGRLIKPKRALVGFDKTKVLEVGESETLNIDIKAKDFSVYDNNNKSFILEKGTYSVFVGGSIKESEKVYSFTIDEEKLIEKTISVNAPLEFVGSIDGNGKVSQKTIITEAKNAIKVKAKFIKKDYKELPKYKGKTITISDVKKDNKKLDDFVSQFTINELVDFTVCNGHRFGPRKSGVAGVIAHSKRLGVPMINMSDGNSSVNLNDKTTGFPATNMLAGTFNKDLAYEVGKVLAKESKENDIQINLGPGGNLHRNLLAGRHSEYHSEDPILTGVMMAYQAMGLEDNGILSTYKHFLANNMEFQRKASHSVLDERTLRELYLRVFDKAFDIYKPSCVMTSYNPVNGIYPSENSILLNDLLRDRWNFDGFVMTDWASYDTSNSVNCVNGGTNLLTPGSKKYFKLIKKAFKSGEISKATLQNSVKQIIKTLIKCI